MKPRHAAALAVWLILVPPFNAGHVDLYAPLIRWRVYSRLYPSGTDCETAKRQFINLASSADARKAIQTRLNLPASSGILDTALAAEKKAICVSSDDPRFKPK